MFCSACGVALAQSMKYCNRCGANLVTTTKAAEIESIEKRVDSGMEGLFWIIVFGIGLTVGGMVLMKKVEFNEWLIVAYMALSSVAFITYFGVTLWQVRRLAKMSSEAIGVIDVAPFQTDELSTANPLPSLQAAPSVTDHTTRTLEPVPEERARNKPPEVLSDNSL